MKRFYLKYSRWCHAAIRKNFSTHTAATSVANKPIDRAIGQPTSFTHPFLMKEDEVTPSLTKSDYELRRSTLLSSVLGANILEQNQKSSAHVVILLGEAIQYMSEDIPYPFHQNTNFRYLTGFLEPESCLIMETFPNDSTNQYKSTLLVPELNASQELWHGARAGTEGALAHTGVHETKPMQDLPKILTKYLSEEYTIWYDFKKPTNIHLHMKKIRPFLNDAFDKKISICGISDLIHQQRLIKTEKEIFLIAQAGLITSEAFKRTMPVSYPGMNEAAIQALIDCECRIRGAQMLAYPPVVAGGSRANTLHYVFNDQRISDGDLVLVDAGAEFHGYVADITRTWPINGRFSPPQRALYECVLNVQKACVDLCLADSSLNHIHKLMCLMIARELVENKILKAEVKQEDLVKVGQRYCPHHIGHWLGMDVHDTDVITKSTNLKPGMVVTIEPASTSAMTTTWSATNSAESGSGSRMTFW